MDQKWLKAINILTIPAVLAILLFFWTAVPRDQFMWGIILIILLLGFVFYANVRKPIIDHIDARRRIKNKPVDVKGERRLRIINFLAVIAIFAIVALSWTMLPRDQFVWAVYLMLFILLLVFGVNLMKVLSDIA